MRCNLLHRLKRTPEPETQTQARRLTPSGVFQPTSRPPPFGVGRTVATRSLVTTSIGQMTKYGQLPPADRDRDQSEFSGQTISISDDPSSECGIKAHGAGQQRCAPARVHVGQLAAAALAALRHSC